MDYALRLVPLGTGSGSYSNIHGEGAFTPEEPQSEVRPRTEVATLPQVHAAPSFLAKIPVVVLSPEKILAERLDHRSGFVLSLLDGTTTVEELLDVSGMSEEETLVVLEDLRARGIVAL